MDKVLKFLILSLLFVVLFFSGSFPSRALYWITYAFIGVLIVPLWFAMFWVSKKKAYKTIGKTPDFDFFCARVPYDVQSDLSRGRMCFYDGKVILVKKNGKETKIDWEKQIDEITSISFGNVAKIRKGFTINYKEGSTDFTCASITKHKDELYKALGWK